MFREFNYLTQSSLGTFCPENQLPVHQYSVVSLTLGDS